MKILFLDIETSPILGWTWGFHQTDVLDIYEDWRLLGYAYAWNDGKVQATYPDPHQWSFEPPGPSSSRDFEEGKLLAHIHALLDQADIVVAHNGDKFDIRKLQAKFVEYDLGPVSSFLTVDTLKEARKYGMFTSNKLDQLGRRFDLGGKDSIPMMATQFALMHQDTAHKAFRDMKKYNKRDVELLRDLYEKLRPYMKSHPTVFPEGCPVCGHEELTSRGPYTTKSGIQYQRYQCKSCGKYSRSRKRVAVNNDKVSA